MQTETVNNKELWGKCLEELEDQLSTANFSTWFKNTHIYKRDRGIATVGVPNEFVKEWLGNKYTKTILKTVLMFDPSVRNIEFTISKTEPKEDKKRSGLLSPYGGSLPLQNLYINKDDNLNPRYTFETFIVGSFNELAYAAAQAIIKNPGNSYNPFFIYGQTGLGKTHLIQAVGNAIKKKHPTKKVFYATLEKFSLDYITSLQKNRPNEFKQKYRQYDVIIMDDIQFLSGKEKTQEELFHLFNTLYEQNKQIVFSSDKHPNYIPGLEDRLKSRFGSGMIVDVSTPEYESRLAIVKTKVQEADVDLADDIIDYIASSMEGSIRELEGSLNTILCQAQLKTKPLSVSEVKSLIKNNIKPKKNVSISDIVKIVTDFYNINEQSVYEKTRRKEIVRARQIIMYLLREDFSISYPMIGQKLGGKDHTTVIHSCLKIKTELGKQPALVQDLERLRVMYK
ncbi:MAG: chromosomal replication initiator protein [Candidatus Paceibacteria bacterium]|jgi:chromosomal replication initiator protein